MGKISLTTTILKGMENSSSLGMFLRDTGGCLSAKLAVSRSKDEAKEIGFQELTESSIFYFSAPVLAKAASDVFAKKYNIDKKLITEPVKNVENIAKDKLKDVKLAKFGQIASTFGIILPMVFAIAPVRNILTQLNSGKEKFTSVVGLENNKNEELKEQSKHQAINYAKKTALVSSLLLGSTFAFLNKAKNDKFYNKIEPAVSTVVKNFEFTKSNDLKLSHYGALIYPVSIASYFIASRDKYEKQENIRRFAVTVPLLFFGEKLIEKPIHKTFDKLFNTKVIENGIIKSYNEILKLPDKLQKQYLKSKNSAFGLTFLINTMVIASMVGILNRIKTKNEFQKEQKNNTIIC